MQNIVRAFVVVLVLTGAAASSITSAHASTKVTATKGSACPTPMCAPDDPKGCGIGDRY